MKAVVAAFNQEKALVGAFSVITNLRMERFEALEHTVITESAVLADVGSNKLQFRLEESDFAKYPNYRAFLQRLGSRTEQGGFRCGVSTL